MEKQNWYFTFGTGHEHADRFVKIYGTFIEARNEMFERFGSAWAFQYSEAEWERMRIDPLRFWPMPTELQEEEKL